MCIACRFITDPYTQFRTFLTSLIHKHCKDCLLLLGWAVGMGSVLPPVFANFLMEEGFRTSDPQTAVLLLLC